MSRRETNREINVRFGKNLRRLRERHKMTRAELALWFKVDERAVEKMELGIRPLMISHLLWITYAFEMQFNEVIKSLEDRT